MKTREKELKLDDGRLVIPIRAEQTKVFGDLEESWTTRVLLSVVPEWVSDTELTDALQMGSSNRGPGQPFSSSPCVFRTRTRTLVSQSGGWDI